MLRLLERKSLFVVGAVRPLRTAPELADPACVVSAHLKRAVRSPFRLGSKNIWVSGRHPAPPRRGGCPSEPELQTLGLPLPALASRESGLESKERLSSWFLKSLNFSLEPQLQFVFRVENL